MPEDAVKDAAASPILKRKAGASVAVGSAEVRDIYNTKAMSH
jgi:hypothetical protein